MTTFIVLPVEVTGLPSVTGEPTTRPLLSITYFYEKIFVFYYCTEYCDYNQNVNCLYHNFSTSSATELDFSIWSKRH